MPCSFGLVWLISHAESTVGWFGVREKYCSLADKTWLINQIRPSEQTDNDYVPQVNQEKLLLSTPSFLVYFRKSLYKINRESLFSKKNIWLSSS